MLKKKLRWKLIMKNRIIAIVNLNGSLTFTINFFKSKKLKYKFIISELTLRIFCKKRQWQDLNLRVETTSDFKSDALDHSATLSMWVAAQKRGLFYIFETLRFINSAGFQDLQKVASIIIVLNSWIYQKYLSNTIFINILKY